jgi:hypothetical protein
VTARVWKDGGTANWEYSPNALTTIAAEIGVGDLLYCPPPRDTLPAAKRWKRHEGGPRFGELRALLAQRGLILAWAHAYYWRVEEDGPCAA